MKANLPMTVLPRLDNKVGCLMVVVLVVEAVMVGVMVEEALVVVPIVVGIAVVVEDGCLVVDASFPICTTITGFTGMWLLL